MLDEDKKYTTFNIRKRRKELNCNLANRIHNGKFGQALLYVDNEPEPVKELMKAFANVLGNIGWFGSKADIEEWVDWESIEFKNLLIIFKNALANIGCASSLLAYFCDEEEGNE